MAFLACGYWQTAFPKEFVEHEWKCGVDLQQFQFVALASSEDHQLMLWQQANSGGFIYGSIGLSTKGGCPNALP